MLAAIAPLAAAHDYGRVGSTWAIAEPDLLEVIRARLQAAAQNGALDAMNRKFVALTEASVRRPHAVAGITPARADRQWEFDPTVTLVDDIRNAKGQVLVAKGQRFNPLDHIAMAHRYAFIDGDNPAELAWAKAQGKPEQVWIVLTKGAPLDLMKAEQRKVYFDQQGVLTGRFGIEHTPALLMQAGNHLVIHEVALPEKGRQP